MRWPIILSILAFALLTGVAFAVRPLLKEEVAVVTPTPKPEVTITIPEGWRREQIAALVEEKGVCSYGDFLAASSDAEGTLFPDTYRFFPSTPCEDVVKTLTETYTRRTKDLPVSRDALILASIVEREAITDSERPTIAGVYTNRLKIGMKLDADPTVQYGKDTNAWTKAGRPSTYSFWEPITRADYQGVSSPYNTYTKAGLPPTPIANPGLKSIQATLSPENHEYFFFFHRNGTAYFSRTFAEHQAKLARF